VAGVAVAAGGSLENFQANVPLESELLVIVSLQTVGSPVELEHLPSRLRSKYELEEWHFDEPQRQRPTEQKGRYAPANESPGHVAPFTSSLCLRVGGNSWST
jgi:hypothetical protein